MWTSEKPTQTEFAIAFIHDINLVYLEGGEIIAQFPCDGKIP